VVSRLTSSSDGLTGTLAANAVDPLIGTALHYGTGDRYTFLAIAEAGDPIIKNINESASYGAKDAGYKDDFTTYSPGCDSLYWNRYTLSLFNPGSSSGFSRTLYINFGYFNLNQTYFRFPDSNDYRSFAYGHASPASVLPTSGSVTYTGAITGRSMRNPSLTPSDPREFDSTPYMPIDGSFSITVDFAQKSFAGNVTLRAIDGSNSHNLGTFPIAQTGMATLSPLTGSAGNGALKGLLAGPAGSEAGISFHMTVPDPRKSGKVLDLVASGAGKH